MRVLVVPASAPVAKKVEGYLDEQQVEVVKAETPEQAIESAGKTKPCAIIAVDGRTKRKTVDAAKLARKLRADGRGTPMLVVNTTDAEDRTVSALDSGADDVVTPSTSLDEVGSRIRALSRRCHAVTGTPRQIGDLAVDLQNRTVRLGQREVQLTAREFDVLELLSRSPGDYRSREEIHRTCWQGDGRPRSNVVDVIISRIRSKLLKLDPREFVVTSKARGYRLIDPAHEPS